jgi:DNA-directed RNA polymerase subunit alpha
MRIRWRGLELPTRVLRDEQASKPTYGRFIVEPFERGFGTTIGNSLRRILLSSLEGAAVTQVCIEGAEHEFTTLPGVVEDVTVIILNVKSLIVRLSTDTPKTMRVNVKGKSGETTEVRAAQIAADPAIEIINKDQLLATLTGDVEFKMEMTVGRGRGYATAEENKPEGDQIIGPIPVDSVYSPVTRVRYRVEDTRVGQRTNYDRLIMEVWTNGTVTPEMALVEAAKILRKHVNTFVQYFEIGSGLAVDGAQGETEVGGEAVDESLLAMPLSALELSVRANNCLASANISTVGALLQWDEARLLKIRSLGKTSLREIKRKLADLGLSLHSVKGAAGEAAEEAGAEEGEEAQFDVEDKAAPMGEFRASPPSPPAAPPVEFPAAPPGAPQTPASSAPANKEVGVTGEAAG